jgi:hypothetical protein
MDMAHRGRADACLPANPVEADDDIYVAYRNLVADDFDNTATLQREEAQRSVDPRFLRSSTALERARVVRVADRHAQPSPAERNRTTLTPGGMRPRAPACN